MEWRPSVHLGIEAIEKGEFWSPSTQGRQLYLQLLGKVVSGHKQMQPAKMKEKKRNEFLR